MRIGEVLASHGVVSRFAVDFLVWRDSRREDWNLAALEINLRMGGTTHPYLALQFLTGGQLDPPPASSCRPRRHAKYYRATDNLQLRRLPRPAARGPDRDPHRTTGCTTATAPESGVLFHLIGAVSEFGKLGLTAIGNSRDEVDELYQRTLGILDAETALGR